MPANSRHFGLAIAAHVVLFLFLLVGIHCKPTMAPPPVMVAVMVNPSAKTSTPTDAPRVVDEQKREDNDDQVKAEQAQKRQEELKKVEQKKQDDAKKAEQKKLEQQKNDEKKQQEDQQKKADEAKKLAEAEAKKQSELALKKAQEEEQKKQADAAAAKAKAEADAKAKAEADAKKAAEEAAKAAAEAEAKRKQEAAAKAAEEKKRQEEAARRAQEDLARQAMAEEAARMEGERIAGVQATWAQQLAAYMRPYWTRPEGLPDNIRCQVEITLLPSGAVANVRVLKSSGNPSFDQSVTSAVLRASPLPLPSDPKAFVRILQPIYSPASLQ